MTTIQYNIDSHSGPVNKIQKNKISKQLTKTKAKSIDIIRIESVKDDLKRYATDTINPIKQDAGYKHAYSDIKIQYDTLQKEMKDTIEKSKLLTMSLKGLQGTIAAKNRKIERLENTNNNCKIKTKLVTKYIEKDINTMIDELTDKLKSQPMYVFIFFLQTCTFIEMFLPLFYCFLCKITLIFIVIMLVVKLLINLKHYMKQ